MSAHPYSLFDAAGSGRTGLIAAVLLLQQGLSVEEATRQVRALRPNALKHSVHCAWLEKCAARHGSGGES